MDRNFQRALQFVLKHEGGWADHPSDPGGATMKGITIATYRRFINAKGTKTDLRNITAEQIADIYRRQYWNAVKADELPDGLDYAVFDFAVNSGPDRAAKYLQAAVGVAQDGKIGPATLNALEAHPAGRLINSLCDARLSFLRKLKTWNTFGKGWSSRVAGVRKEALAMAGNPAPKAALPVEPVVVHIEDKPLVINPGKAPVQPNKDGPLWGLLFWVMGLIWGKK